MNIQQAEVKGTGPECAHVWALIDALGDEDPSPEALAEIAEHFSSCANCAGAEQSLEGLLVLYRSQENISIPGGLEQRLLDCMCGGNAGHEGHGGQEGREANKQAGPGDVPGPTTRSM